MYCICINDNQAPIEGSVPQWCRVFDRKPSQWDFSRSIQEFLMGVESQEIQAKVFALSDEISEESGLVVVTGGNHKNFVGMLLDECLEVELLQVVNAEGQSVIAPRSLVKCII